MHINKEWVNHIFREVSAGGGSEAVVVAPFGWYARIDLQRLETWSGIVRELLHEIPIPKKGEGGLLLDDLVKDKKGHTWGGLEEAEKLSILAKALGLIDYGLPKFGRSLPVVFLEP